MRSVTAKTEDVIAKLTENRAKHVEEVKEAKKKYAERVREEAELLVKKISDGEKFSTRPLLNLPAPESYQEHYDQALDMLSLHQKDTIPLDLEEYRQYYLDEWQWTRASKATISNYLV